MLTRDQVIFALENTDGLPSQRGRQFRTIYEIAGPKGHFCLDYASFTGGTAEEVPRTVIDDLEREGIIERAFPGAPHVNGWKLKGQSR